MIGFQGRRIHGAVLPGVLFVLTAACNEDAPCKCGGCWDCVDVGTNASDDERPDYTSDTVVQLAAGSWDGTHPDAPDVAPLHVQVTVGAKDGLVSYRAARAIQDGASCEIPADAVDQCAGLRVPAQVDIVTDREGFSTVLSELTVYGRLLSSADDRPEARHYEGFPSVDWQVLQDGREYNLTLLFSSDARLWMSITQGTPAAFVEIGEKR